MATKLPAAQNRLFKNMFVCKKLKSVARAANALYDAGIWSCDRPISESAEAAMWEQLRDALGRTPGFGPKPFKDD